MTAGFRPLWDALLAAPDDNGLKLICADWLADHGADPELEAGLRACSYHRVFPHELTIGTWFPRFPWRWGTPSPVWPDTAVPPSHLMAVLVSASGLPYCPDSYFNRTVHHDPAQLVRWLGWAVAECQKSPDSVGGVART